MCVCVYPLTSRLSVRMVDVDIHRPVQRADQHGLVGAQCFMSSVDGLGLPVGPVDVILKQSHGEDVWDIVIQHCTEGNMYARHKLSYTTYIPSPIALLHTLKTLNIKTRCFIIPLTFI